MGTYNHFNVINYLWHTYYLSIYLSIYLVTHQTDVAQLARAVEYTDCFSAEG